MRIHIHIDRIVLDGVGLEARDTAALRDRIVSELTLLLTQSPAPRRSVYRSQVYAAAAIDCAPGRAALGRNIARSLHGALREGQHR